LFRIGEAISFLQNNFDQEIYLEELARIAHMSRRNFLRVFREALGASPMAYLNQIRVARAVELLRHGGRSVTQIGFDVGFLDGNYFCRQFCQIMGESPGRHARRFERQRCGSPTIRNGEI
jgi:transcriptional regulator GlxA family with amidase domain